MNTPSPTPNTHGGARPGAGRKPKPKVQAAPPQLPTRAPHEYTYAPVAKYGHTHQDALDYCADRLAQSLATLESLANGTAQSVQERWVAAGTLTVGTGPNARPMFPDLPPEQLVLVSRTTQTPKPDARAAIYLADRVLGRPLHNDEARSEEQIKGELNLFIERVRASFTPQLAQTIFHVLSLPEPPATLLDGPLPENQLPHPSHPHEGSSENQDLNENQDPGQKPEQPATKDPLPQPQKAPDLLVRPTPKRPKPKHSSLSPQLLDPAPPEPSSSAATTNADSPSHPH